MPEQRLGKTSILQLACDTSRSNRLLRDEVAQCGAAAGLSDSDILVLYLCTYEKPVPQTSVGQMLGNSAARISMVVEKLRSLKLIEATRDPADRRKQLWHATRAGSDCIEQVEAELKKRMGTTDLPQILRTGQEAA